MEVKINGSKLFNRFLDMIVVFNWLIEVCSLIVKIVKKFEFLVSFDFMIYFMFLVCNGFFKMDVRGQFCFVYKLVCDMFCVGGRNFLDWIFDEGYVYNLVCRVSRMDEIFIKFSEF